MICTDHAPHHYDAKGREFDDHPTASSLETALVLAITELVDGGLIDLATLVTRMSTIRLGSSTCPAVHWPVRRGGRGPDRPGRRVDVEPETFYSKSRNTPFAGRRLRGRADVTIVRGR